MRASAHPLPSLASARTRPAVPADTLPPATNGRAVEAPAVRTGPAARTDHAALERRRKETGPDPKGLAEFRRYARGRHRNTLDPALRLIINQVTGHLFADNVCRRILTTLRDRLALARYAVDGQGATYDALIAFLRELWTLNHVPALAGRVHFATLRDGDHAVTLGYRKTSSRPGGRVVIRRDLWWDGKTGVWVGYDEDGEPELAVREWEQRVGDTTTRRRTVYYADRIERFYVVGGTWRPYRLASDPEGTDGVVPWTRDGREGGEPLGLPVVHFANLAIPQDPDGEETKEQPDPNYGASELDGGMLGLQDEVNDVQRDLTAAARFTAYQTLAVTGYSGRSDANGNPVKVEVVPGTILTEPNKEARITAIAAGDLTQLISALNRKVETMSEMAQVPIHYIRGDWPSGEALLRAETPLVNKVVELGRQLAPKWGSVGHKAVVLANAFGNAGLDEAAVLQAVFAAPEQLDALTLSEIANARDGVVSNREKLRLIGYSPEQIELIEGEREEEQAQALQRKKEELEIEASRVNTDAERRD